MFHERMARAAGAVDIKFFFQEIIHGRVQGKRRTGRPGNTQTAVQIKTPGALGKKLQFGTAKLKRFPRIGIKEIPYPLAVRHRGLGSKNKIKSENGENKSNDGKNPKFVFHIFQL
jgi:hypothetical protein